MFSSGPTAYQGREGRETVNRFAVIVVLALLVTGCKSEDILAEREAYWTGELAVFFSESRTLAELRSWLREHEVIYTFDEQEVVDGEWSVVLEQVDGDGLVCAFWLARLEVKIQSGGMISDHAFSKEGMCL
ncbi:MAG: hypothetical protein HKN13_00100 [Rhodothermales bacterium]|nr:hypothetical protein [Rhodothermales bacterium]